MPYEIELPRRWKKAGWKVKIQDNECLEEPHVTLLDRHRRWRVGLRDGRFLEPPGGSWHVVPQGVRDSIRSRWRDLQTAWDERYPHNPIGGGDVRDNVFVLDGSRGCREALAPLRPRFLRSPGDVATALREADRRSLWIATDGPGGRRLMRGLTGRPCRRHGTLLLLSRGDAIGSHKVSLLSAWFDRVVAPPRSILSRPRLAAVLALEDRGELCIGGCVDREAGVAILIRGDLQVMSVSLSDFPVCADGTSPDFDRFEVADHGRTLRFGRYESSFDTVLYLHDPDFRRRVRARRAATERTLGASIRRLRLQRRLRLEDLGPIARSVARIERGDVSRPHRATLAALARRLRVRPEHLGDY